MSYPKCYKLLAERLVASLEAAGYVPGTAVAYATSLLEDAFANETTLELMRNVVATEPDAENDELG